MARGLAPQGMRGDTADEAARPATADTAIPWKDWKI